MYIVYSFLKILFEYNYKNTEKITKIIAKMKPPELISFEIDYMHNFYSVYF